MATKIIATLLCWSLFLSSHSSFAQFLLQGVPTDGDQCKDVCKETYPSHTYEESTSGEICMRGCRFYSLIDLVGESDDTNKTLHICFENCHEAHPELESEASACVLGCNSQMPFASKMLQLNQQNDMTDVLSPFDYMFNLANDMMGQVSQHMSMSVSFFLQDGKGHLVIVKSQPQVVEASDMDDFDDILAYHGTSSNAETNLGPWDNTATEMLRRSQLTAHSMAANDLAPELNAAETYWGNGPADDGANSDWLTCIARRTGIPRLILCAILLLSAVAMIWLCMSAAVTAPEQRLVQPKLSIYGDLEYLRKLTEKDGIKGVHPQDFVEARPLPVKIRVDQI